VPDKRQTSKQRRAARNRASRDALAARKTNVVASAAAGNSTSTSSSTSSRGNSGGATAGGTANPRRGVLGTAAGGKRPGDRAVLAALGLSVISAIAMLFLRVRVDDRGEALPSQFRGVAIRLREAITGEQPLPESHKTLLEVQGPAVLVFVLLPVAIAAFAFWANRRRADRGRVLMFAMLAMAGAVVIGGAFLFFPSLIALAIASYQVRKAEAPARVAEKVAPVRRRRGEVIDADSTEVDEPESSADQDLGGEDLADFGGEELPDYSGDDAADSAAEAASHRDDEAAEEPAGDGNDGSDEAADPLAELEAEIEAEERTRKPGGSGGSGGSGGTTPDA
jgi:hypothetical protein